MNFALTGDRVAVKLDESISKTEGGIFIPDDAREKNQRGTVVAVGPGKFSEHLAKHVPINLDKGSRVIVEKYGQTKIEIDGEELAVVHEEDVLAILPKEVAGKKK